MNALTKNEVSEFLKASLKDWSYDGSSIHRDLKFKNFTEAFSFMTAVALEAEKADHHPDWSNVYNQVSINLNTHSAGGITKMDFELAQAIDRILKKYQ